MVWLIFWFYFFHLALLRYNRLEGFFAFFFFYFLFLAVLVFVAAQAFLSLWRAGATLVLLGLLIVVVFLVEHEL